MGTRCQAKQDLHRVEVKGHKPKMKMFEDFSMESAQAKRSPSTRGAGVGSYVAFAKKGIGAFGEGW